MNGGRPRKYVNTAARSRAYRERKRKARAAEALKKASYVHFSSETDVWSTPDWLFTMLDKEFHFTCDVCADDTNAKCPAYFTKDVDGISQKWTGVCWCNPPYGAEIPLWVQKAFEASLYGATVVCLLPARVDTRWWHRFVMDKAEIRYLPGRLKFGGEKNSAPFPSAVVVFRLKGGETIG
jgi:phage N-6-adenine-methyltransferase